MAPLCPHLCIQTGNTEYRIWFCMCAWYFSWAPLLISNSFWKCISGSIMAISFRNWHSYHFPELFGKKLRSPIQPRHPIHWACTLPRCPTTERDEGLLYRFSRYGFTSSLYTTLGAWTCVRHILYELLFLL